MMCYQSHGSITFEKKQLGDAFRVYQTNSTIKGFLFDINFHQFYVTFAEMTGINKILVSSSKLPETEDGLSDCSSISKNVFCEEFALNNQSNIAVNKTKMNCMQALFVYVVPMNDTNTTQVATVQILINLLGEDKACSGFLNSEYMMQCSMYKVDQCLFTPECYSGCGALECFKGEESVHPFHQLVIPQNLTSDNAKNLCIFYASLDKQCQNCQVYNDILQFESKEYVLKPFQQFILSIILVFIVIFVILVIYYNGFLAYRSKPPFTACTKWCPQFIFPRGIEGLGLYTYEEENKVDEFKTFTPSNRFAGGSYGGGPQRY